MKNKIPLIGLVFGTICGWSSSIAAAEFVALDPVGTTLEDFFTAALNYSPRLKIAEESVKISSARERAAKGRLLPQLNASANVSEIDAVYLANRDYKHSMVNAIHCSSVRCFLTGKFFLSAIRRS